MIHFVGAGCGAKDLITVRGMKLLERAECVIYAGSLVNPQLLEYCKSDAKIFNSATMNLDEVMEIMLSEAKNNKEVVRLHTGDPCLYGAIEEQMSILDEQHIEYDVTPGVTAAFGAAASIKTELTLPGITQTVIFTRVEGKTPMPDAESIKNLAQAKASMAVYLSATRVNVLRNELLQGGYDRSTPVAVCYKVSWPDEKIIITNIEKLEEVVIKEKLTLTTLFIISNAINQKDFDKSKLYSADFSTIFREAKS